MKTGWWSVKFEISFDGNDNVRFDDLPDSDQEHIIDMIKDGYTSGEIVNEDDEEEYINEEDAFE